MLRRTKAASSTSINSAQRHGAFHGVVAASDAQTPTVHGHDPAISTQHCDICERINTTPVQKTTVHLVARMTKYDQLTELSETNICSTDADFSFFYRATLCKRGIDYATALYPCISPSVCDKLDSIKTAKHINTQTKPLNSPCMGLQFWTPKILVKSR